MSPRKQERVFEKKYSKSLIVIADGDYRTAAGLQKVPNIRIENAFYMAQQAIEKSLKAVLVAKGVAVPMVHDLGSLLAKLPEDCIPPYGYELNELNQFASIRRYEEGVWTPTQEELEAVLQQAKDMLEWARQIID